MGRNKGKKRLPALFLLALLFLFPVLYMLFRSVYAVGDGISFLSYYEVLLGRPEYLVRFFRSLGMCLLIAAGQTLISCLAGTAFAKYRFIGDRFWFAVFVLFMILPIQVTLLPNYILLEMLGFLNSWKALIIPAVFSPFGTVWLTFVFRAVPDGSLDAARIDGANQLQLIRYIITPAAKPAVVTLFLLTFTESWNMVEQPMIFLEREQDYPLSVFLAAVSQGDIGIQSVCGLLCLVPVTFFFLYYREELTDGLKDVLWG